MLDSRRILGRSAVAAAALALCCAAVAAASPGEAKLTVHPRKAMVNTETTVKGRGFPASTTIVLRECGRTFWLDPADPCVEGATTSVMTDAKGRFQTTIKVGLCPEGEMTKKPTQRICYVGRFVGGEDTGSLEPATRLVVTYP